MSEKLLSQALNHETEAEYLADAAASIVGADKVDRHQPPRLGGEDFSYMLQAKPGALIFVGNGNTANLHHPEYDFNDDALPYGIALWSRIVEERLPLNG